MKIRNLFFAGIIVSVGLLISCTKDTIEKTIVNADTTVIIKFSTDIYPLFGANSCLECHDNYGDLNLSGTPSVVRNNLIAFGSVIPNNAATSTLFTYFDGASHEGKTFTTTEVTNIKTWINAGALDN